MFFLRSRRVSWRGKITVRREHTKKMRKKERNPAMELCGFPSGFFQGWQGTAHTLLSIRLFSSSLSLLFWVFILHVSYFPLAGWVSCAWVCVIEWNRRFTMAEEEPRLSPPPIFFVVTALLTHSSSFLFLLFRILLRVSVYVKQNVGRRAGRINIQRAVICERIKQRRRSIKVKFPYCHFISICVHRVTGQRHDAIPYWRETLWSFLNICFEIRNWTELRQTIPITYQITGIARLTNLLFLLFLRYFFIQTFQRPTQKKTFLRLRFGCHHNSFAFVCDVNRLMITSPAKKKAVNGRVDPKCVAFV